MVAELYLNWELSKHFHSLAHRALAQCCRVFQGGGGEEGCGVGVILGGNPILDALTWPSLFGGLCCLVFTFTLYLSKLIDFMGVVVYF